MSLLIWEGLGHEDPCQVIGPSSLSLRRPEGGGEISWAWESDRPELEAGLYHLLCDLKPVTYPLCLSFLIYKVRGNNNNTYMTGFLGGLSRAILLWPGTPQALNECWLLL